MTLEIELLSQESVEKVEKIRKNGINITALINLFLLDLKI